jgi:hypothetical protein
MGRQDATRENFAACSGVWYEPLEAQADAFRKFTPARRSVHALEHWAMMAAADPRRPHPVLGVSGDGAQRLGSRVKQDVVHQRLVLVGDGGDFLGHGEDHVEIFDRKQFTLAVLQPLGANQGLALRTMAIPATVKQTR